MTGLLFYSQCRLLKWLPSLPLPIREHGAQCDRTIIRTERSLTMRALVLAVCSTATPYAALLHHRDTKFVLVHASLS